MSRTFWTFFVVLAAPAILGAKKSASLGVVALACLFVGMVAGGKYTGLGLAALLGVMFLLEVCQLKFIVPFGFAAVVAGCWPHLRNWRGELTAARRSVCHDADRLVRGTDRRPPLLLSHPVRECALR